MPLVKVNDLLRHATENHYGVAAVNVCNYETIKWVAEAAGRERIPVIIQFDPGFEKYIALKHVAAIAKEFAEKSEVPIGVHLDHSAGYGIAVGGVRDGFPSVMVDGSALPYEENVALTAAVVQAAGVFNVEVEAELGHVGSGANVDDIVNADHYTNVEQAVEFVERTGCGSLAVAVGNAHGAYVQTPNLDFERIAELLWHCGPFPYSLKDSGCQARLVGGQERFELKKGDITVCRFDDCDGKYYLFGGEGRAVDGPQTNGTYVWFETDNWKRWEEKMMFGPYIHHVGGIYGNYKPVLREAARYLGLIFDDADEQGVYSL